MGADVTIAAILHELAMPPPLALAYIVAAEGLAVLWWVWVK
jgi:hypothetical protein